MLPKTLSVNEFKVQQWIAHLYPEVIVLLVHKYNLLP